ncbi:MAG: hypothetical protein QNK36_10205, partial [Colwellia sp.]|nr:hypothetical protein [Colwellia sp.]
MRFFKTIFITVVALFTIFSIVYSARISVIKNLAEEQLNLYQIKISCLDISLASNMAIIVDKLCLESPKAEIELVDVAVQWQYLPQFKITNIEIKRAYVKGTEHLLSNISPIPEDNEQRNEHSNNNQNINQLLSVILSPYIKQIKQFYLPTKINVVELSYLPFTVKNKAKISTTSSISQQKV